MPLNALDLSKQLIRFRSINPPGEEKECSEFIARLLLSVYDDDVLRFGMFTPLRLTFERNILVASGFAPTVNP